MDANRIQRLPIVDFHANGKLMKVGGKDGNRGPLRKAVRDSIVAVERHLGQSAQEILRGRYYTALKAAQNELAYITAIKTTQAGVQSQVLAGLVTGGVTVGQWLVARAQV